MPRSDDEVIADSEEEDSMMLEPVEKTGGQAGVHAPSSIQTASTLHREASEISAFTHDANISRTTVASSSSISKPSTPSVNAASKSTSSNRPRPKPKPAYKGAPGVVGSNGTPSDAPSAIDTSTGSAPPASSSDIQTASSSNKGRVSTGSASSSAKRKALDMSTEIIEVYSQDIAEVAKMRSRVRQAKATGKQPAPPQIDDVIELSSDADDELSLLPPLKPSKSKPRKSPPPRKRAKTSHPPTEESDPPPLPVLSPDILFDLGSQLPPSDPPPPSTASAPPVSPPSDLAAARNNDTPPSSPLPRPSRVRKRKPAAPLPDIEDDTMHLDAHNLQDEPPLPPPAFFAGSSSSPPVPVPHGRIESLSSSKGVSGATNPDDGGAKPKAKTKGRKDEANNDSGAVEAPTKSKSKARKKARDDDDDEWNMAQEPALKARKKAADNDDDDWDGDAPPNPKRKAPAKKKGKKVAVEKQVEGASKARKSSTSKGKEKAKAPTSKEFIDDSDEERDTLLMPPPKDVPQKAANSGRTSASTSGGSVDDNLERNPFRAGIEGQDIVDLSGVKEAQDSPLQTSKSTSTSNGTTDNSSESTPASSKSKGKKRAIVLSDGEEEEVAAGSRSAMARRKEPGKIIGTGKTNGKDPEEQDSESDKSKENLEPSGSASMLPPPPPSRFSSSSRAYSIGLKKSTPMSELIRKVNSLPGSPFASPRPTYSPYAKSSKNLLKRIAPLHANRRTPPPPLPRPPPPKKTKKQLELEEKWEMELEESVEGWYCLSEEERATLRRAKRDMEMGVED
ncbi:hypothetical protein SCP_1202410 [Sparassis crispa]|uniref:Uncharacterized protein n=1 Tax=Sparassis crispa TaxID=139825 RepID=A0A401H0R5_9APHY|nr:hypothetical protein SCP_1202410 [Sparassis crispa]GBE88015.1 hypothetical protein SCP_1202410 [Sparassis crispa]